LSAFRRNKKNLYLKRGDIVQNLNTEYRQNQDPLKVERKLQDLDEVNVLDYDGNEVTSVDAVYEEVNENLPTVG